MARPKMFSKRIDLCVTPKQLKILKEMAENSQLTINELLRKLINDFYL